MSFVLNTGLSSKHQQHEIWCLSVFSGGRIKSDMSIKAEDRLRHRWTVKCTYCFTHRAIDLLAENGFSRSTQPGGISRRTVKPPLDCSKSKRERLCGTTDKQDLRFPDG